MFVGKRGLGVELSKREVAVFLQVKTEILTAETIHPRTPHLNLNSIEICQRKATGAKDRSSVDGLVVHDHVGRSECPNQGCDAQDEEHDSGESRPALCYAGETDKGDEARESSEGDLRLAISEPRLVICPVRLSVHCHVPVRSTSLRLIGRNRRAAAMRSVARARYAVVSSTLDQYSSARIRSGEPAAR